jgi:hypothetical protein
MGYTDPHRLDFRRQFLLVHRFGHLEQHRSKYLVGRRRLVRYRRKNQSLVRHWRPRCCDRYLSILGGRDESRSLAKGHETLPHQEKHHRFLPRRRPALRQYRSTVHRSAVSVLYSGCYGMYKRHRLHMAFDSAVPYLVSDAHFCGGYLCWYSIFPSFADLGIFLRHWWVRRKRLNESWSLGMRNGISQTEFNRLVVTVLSVIFLYLPLSIYFLVEYIKLVRQASAPFTWSADHGPESGLIIKEPQPTAQLVAWVAPVTSLTSFFFIGFTRNARQFYERCIEWAYDHSPAKLQGRLSGMRKISEASKERRVAKSSLTGVDGRTNISMVERYFPQEDPSNLQ